MLRDPSAYTNKSIFYRAKTTKGQELTEELPTGGRADNRSRVEGHQQVVRDYDTDTNLHLVNIMLMVTCFQIIFAASDARSAPSIVFCMVGRRRSDANLARQRHLLFHVLAASFQPNAQPRNLTW